MTMVIDIWLVVALILGSLLIGIIVGVFLFRSRA
jgi:hypothetical protein